MIPFLKDMKRKLKIKEDIVPNLIFNFEIMR